MLLFKSVLPAVGFVRLVLFTGRGRASSSYGFLTAVFPTAFGLDFGKSIAMAGLVHRLEDIS
jgi:hypothetical protein